MNKKFWWIGGICAAVIVAIVAIAVLKDDSPENWIGKKYKKVSAGTYHSGKAPKAVAAEIGRKHKPIDTVDSLGRSGGGLFLRYPDLVVGVLPDGTGSRITVDDPDSGYRRYHSHVGVLWIAPGSHGWTSGGAASFRGGGPGSGK
ncbi:DUF4247 domain-containing protein [Spirillospora albida]|uniref:DUF4247 domain-containing protein n=1 Tax=Spirillospora albida TaxID=58123 RepID=UPI0004C199A3|nr:DUF4247 domain-containing protein [Spirillospora albida]